MSKRTGNIKRTRRQGLATVEIACAVVFVLVLTLLAVDVTILLVGYDLNDRACRDACKAAAKHSTASAAKNAALTTLSMHRADGTFVTNPKLLNGPENFQFHGPNSPTGGKPSVTITTECRVVTPVPLAFVGSLFNQSACADTNSWTFHKRYTYPISAVNVAFQ